MGFAGPCKLGDSVNRPGLKVPKIGMMVFDSSDISNLESEGRLEDVILHEMGHVSSSSRQKSHSNSSAGSWYWDALGRFRLNKSP